MCRKFISLFSRFVIMGLLGSFWLVAAIPTITSFTPLSCPPDSFVTITGTNFSIAPSENIVWFGAVQAKVSLATTTSLTVKVPYGANAAPITVTVDNLTASSGLLFLSTVYADAVSETSFSDYNQFNGPRGAAVSTVGDIDGDGKPDVLACRYASTYLDIYRNMSIPGIPILTKVLEKSLPLDCYDVRMADIDGDGKIDIIASSYTGGTSTSTFYLSILRNTSSFGSISFDAPYQVQVSDGGPGPTLAVADADGDGKTDIFVGTNYSKIYVFKNLSTLGTLSLDEAIILNKLFTLISDIEVQDLNNDGKPDIACANPSGGDDGELLVFANTSSGGTISFNTNYSYATPEGCILLKLGDFNNDNYLDVLMISTWENEVYIFRNNSGFSFAIQDIYHAGVEIYDDCGIGDVDGDGKLDFSFVHNGSLKAPAIFRNTTSGSSFSFNWYFPDLPMPHQSENSVDIIDMDLDGKADLVGIYNNDGIAIILNQTNAPGEFSASPSSLAFNYPVGTPQSSTITVSNTGDAVLSITSIVSDNPDLSISPTSADIGIGEDTVFTIIPTVDTEGEKTATITFTDITPNGHSRTNEIEVSATGVFCAQEDAGNAINFDGISSYIHIPHPDQPTSYTIDMWVKPSAIRLQSIFVRTGNAGPLSSFSHNLYMTADGHFAHYTYDQWSALGVTVIGTTVAELDTWYHVAITAENNGVIRLFVNGIEEGTPASIVSIWIGGVYYHIGDNRDGGHARFKGVVDEVKIWDSQLTQNQIRTHYGSLAGIESGLIAYWRMDRNVGTILGDATGRGYPGQLINNTRLTSTAPATMPVLAVSPGNIDFENVLIGRSSQMEISILNDGGSFLHLEEGRITNNQFSISPTMHAQILNSSESESYTLTFTPTASGIQSGTIIYPNNMDDSTLTVSGTGQFLSQSNGGNMLTFNGSNQYLQADLAITATDNITMEAWVNWEGQSGSPGILYHGSSGSSGYGIFLSESASPCQSITILCGGKGYVTSSTQLSTNSWHHVAAVRDNGVWKLYLNGEEKNLTNTNIVPNTPTNILNIASLSVGTQLFKGSVDEVRIWNVARSQNQIQSSYASLAGNESGLAGYWRMDEGSGSTTGDGSGHEKTATLINSPAWGSSTAPVTAPLCLLSTTELDFGTIEVGQTCSLSVEMSNTGGSILNVNSITKDHDDFSVTPVTVAILDEQETFTVTFTPTTEASFSGNISFMDNSTGSPHTVLYSATSVSEGALPITLASFLAEEQNGSVLLKWTTASETENLGYVLEKSTGEEQDWERVVDYMSDTTLSGHGTTTENNFYEYSDKSVQPGCTYQYRLGDMDYNNTITWHDVAEITMDGEVAQIPEEFGLQMAYPNPFNPILTIRYGLTEEAQTTVKILNLRGQIVSILENTLQQAGSYGLQWQADVYPSGIYFVQVISGEKRDLRKVLLVK